MKAFEESDGKASVDGTFFVTPKLWKQTFVLSIKVGGVVDSSCLRPTTRQRRDILSCLSFHVEKKAQKQQHQDQSRLNDDGLRNQCSASGCDHLARARNTWMLFPL